MGELILWMIIIGIPVWFICVIENCNNNVKEQHRRENIYDTLIRFPNDCKGKMVKNIRGDITITENSDCLLAEFKIAYGKYMYLKIPYDLLNNGRIIKGDRITIDGMSLGVTTKNYPIILVNKIY